VIRPQRGDGRCKSPPEQGERRLLSRGKEIPAGSRRYRAERAPNGAKSGGTADKLFALSHRLGAFFRMARQIPLLSGPSVQKMMNFYHKGVKNEKY
jgi:hypothetical protein